MRRARVRGFSLLELVVAIAVASVVVGFAAMFVAAPLGAFEAQSRRVALVNSAGDGWVRMHADLRTALPNSVRVRRNGAFVTLEMLQVVGFARYMTPAGGNFTIAGTQGNEMPGVALPYSSTAAYLSINNLGTPGADAYALSGSITPAGATIQIVDMAQPGEAAVTVTPAPVFAGDSPRRIVYLVSGPVTYLCDESSGVLLRYAGYAIAANHAQRDAPADFAAIGAAGLVVARGLTACNYAVSPVAPDRSQTVAVRLTRTDAATGESVSVLRTSRAEFVP